MLGRLRITIAPCSG